MFRFNIDLIVSGGKIDEYLEAMEVFADRDLDPLEVRFGYQDEAGNLNETPTSMDLRFGVDSLLKLKIDQWESEPGEESQEAAEGEAAPAETEEEGGGLFGFLGF